MPSRVSVGRRARLGELAGDAADLDHRQRRREGQHHRHLQEDAKEVADVVGAVLGEAFGAVAAMQQERLAGRDAGEALASAAAPRRQTPAAGRSQAAARPRPAPQGPDNPAPGRSACRANSRASSARPSDTPLPPARGMRLRTTYISTYIGGGPCKATRARDHSAFASRCAGACDPRSPRDREDKPD